MHKTIVILLTANWCDATKRVGCLICRILSITYYVTTITNSFYHIKTLDKDCTALQADEIE